MIHSYPVKNADLLTCSVEPLGSLPSRLSDIDGRRLGRLLRHSRQTGALHLALVRQPASGERRFVSHAHFRLTYTRKRQARQWIQ